MTSNSNSEPGDGRMSGGRGTANRGSHPERRARTTGPESRDPSTVREMAGAWFGARDPSTSRPLRGRFGRDDGFPLTKCILSPHGRRIHLHDAGPPEGRPAPARDPQGDLPLVLPGRQDRRDRVQRQRQVDAAPDHGGGGHRLPGRGEAAGRDPDRLPAAGAGARPGQGRPRQRGGGAPADPRHADAVRADLDEIRRADERRRDGRRCWRSRGRCRTGSTPPTPGRSTTPSTSRWTRCGSRRATPT